MNEIKTIYKWDSPVLNNEIDRIIAGIYLHGREKSSKTFMFCGCSPKAGATTLSISTALAVADSGWNTLLIDTDIRKDPMFKRLNSSGTFLAGYLDNKEIPEEEIIQPTNYENFDYIPSGSTNRNPMRLLCSGQMQKLLAFAKEHYDYVVIDAPTPGAAADACILAPLVDETILVLEWDVTGKEQMTQTKTELEKAGGRLMGVVINRMDQKAYMRYNTGSLYFINKDYVTPESERQATKPTGSHGLYRLAREKGRRRIRGKRRS